MSSPVFLLLSPTEGRVHWGKNERMSLKNPISNVSGSGHETGEGDLGFLYWNILGNHDLSVVPFEDDESLYCRSGCPCL